MYDVDSIEISSDNKKLRLQLSALWTSPKWFRDTANPFVHVMTSQFDGSMCILYFEDYYCNCMFSKYFI